MDHLTLKTSTDAENSILQKNRIETGSKNCLSSYNYCFYFISDQRSPTLANITAFFKKNKKNLYNLKFCIDSVYVIQCQGRSILRIFSISANYSF